MWGTAEHQQLHGDERVQMARDGASRKIADMISSLICHGTLTRFPKLRIASIENGSSWIHPLFDGLEDVHRKMPQNFDEHPHDVFSRNIWVSPFWRAR